MSGRSGTLVVTIEVDKDEEEATIIQVTGNKEAPSEHHLSDVDWFRESWSCIGWKMIWDELPATGTYILTGYLNGWKTYNPDVGEDYDEEFVIETEVLEGVKNMAR